MHNHKARHWLSELLKCHLRSAQCSLLPDHIVKAVSGHFDK